MNMSPVKARAEGKPILLDMKNSMNSMDGGGGETRYSTGYVALSLKFLACVVNDMPYSGRPVLPDELAEEIQQFGQGEFAKQYFTTHRTGFIFRKKIPVEKMMVWQKVPGYPALSFRNILLTLNCVAIGTTPVAAPSLESSVAQRRCKNI